MRRELMDVARIRGEEMTEESSGQIDFEALRRLRVRHSRALKLFILVFVFIFGGLILFFIVPPPVDEWFAWLGQIGWVLAIVLMILSFPFARTPCPRCGKPYYVPSGFWGSLCIISLSYRKCFHCGLPLNAERGYKEQDG